MSTKPTCAICGEPMPPGEETAPSTEQMLLRACRIAHEAISREQTPGPHKQRDMQFVLDQLSEAIKAAAPHPQPEARP